MEGFNRFIFNYLLIVALLTVLSVVVFRTALPGLYPPLLFIIPLFFVLLICVISLSKVFVERKVKSGSVFYLVFRGEKLLLLLAFALVCTFSIKDNLLPFLSVFGIFYFTLLVYECMYFAADVKKRKNKVV